MGFRVVIDRLGVLDWFAFAKPVHYG